MREQGPLIELPTQAGTPNHLPLAWPRYLTASFTAPFCLMIGSMMSFTGSSNSTSVVRPPGRHGKNIVAGFGLRFGGGGQEELVALARDIIELNLDLFLLSPFIHEIGQGLVSAGDPVIPET